jgi:AcrR family transcriptional regulator
MAQKRDKRLCREDWFSGVLENIARTGHLEIRIYRLARCLGVTEGSFYWHFKNRDDFLSGLVNYWAQNYTEVVVEAVNRVHGDATTRLLALVNEVIGKNRTKYDFIVQALAIQEPVVARTIRKVYRRRIEYVSSLFAEMGFRGRELELRTEAFVTYVSLEHGLYSKRSKKERLKLMSEAHAFFTRP